MGPRFADGLYTEGVIAGLDALAEDAPITYQPTYEPTSYDDDADRPVRRVCRLPCGCSSAPWCSSR